MSTAQKRMIRAVVAPSDPTCIFVFTRNTKPTAELMVRRFQDAQRKYRGNKKRHKNNHDSRNKEPEYFAKVDRIEKF